MADKLLISVSATQISAARWRGRHLDRCVVFENNDDGLAAFREFLNPIRNLRVDMIVDAVEEDYRFESLPHSFGAERSELVNRKLKQHYRNTPYCSARIQGRDTGKRRDDRYLFCALTNPDLVAPWVQAVADQQLPIAGVYLLPTVSQGLVEKLELAHTNLLVVSIHSSGTRLTFFRDQKLRVSRLARIDLGGKQAIKGFAEEISNTRLYLHAVRVMTLDEQLSMLIIDRENSLKEVAEAIARDSPNIDCRRLTRQEIVAGIGIAAPALDSSSAALYLYLLGLRAPLSNLAPATVTQAYRRRQARRVVHALAAVSALVVATWCAFIQYQISDKNTETRIATVRAQDLDNQTAVARRTLGTEIRGESFEDAVEIHRRNIRKITMRRPEPTMQVVGRALEGNPAIVLKTLAWKYGTPESETVTAADQARAKAAGNINSGAPGAGKRRESVLINGEVRPFRGDYPAAIKSIERFIAALKQDENVAGVISLKMPLNISSDLTLSGNTTDDNREQVGKAEFGLKVILKERP